MRKLATVRNVEEIKPIKGADFIEACRVGGWWIVGKKGEFQVGCPAVYLEIDSWIPHEVAPFLSKGKEPREFEGVKGERLRTVKLRGQLSQGLLLPLDVLPTGAGSGYDEPAEFRAYAVGEDVTELLGILKWERPIPTQLAGLIKGDFPSFIRKTDEERIQNLTEEFEVWKAEERGWEITEKLDGASMTVYRNGDEYGVCSRNLDLKETDENAFWIAARKYKLIEKLNSYGENIALQGELCGPGIQGNRYNLKELHFFLYNVFDIDRQEKWTWEERYMLANELKIEHVPNIEIGYQIPHDVTVADILERAEHPSKVFDTDREGVVFKDMDNGDVSFKAISNKFLLKGGD